MTEIFRHPSNTSVYWEFKNGTQVKVILTEGTKEEDREKTFDAIAKALESAEKKL